MSEMVASELNDANRERLRYSDSVKGALKEFKKDKQISASDLALELYKRHPEYANDLKVPKLKTTKQRKTGTEWLKQVESLFDATKNPDLNSRRVIVGLCLLEHSLASQLKKELFDLLVDGLEMPLKDILTKKGLDEWKDFNKHLSEPVESVPIWEDNPLKKLNDDKLEHVAFARYLVKRIASIPTESETYVMLLYGPWGSGKSTLLNFIGDELKENKELTSDDWLVVKYNAWREQHVQPLWWSLMNSVFQSIKKQTWRKKPKWENKIHKPESVSEVPEWVSESVSKVSKYVSDVPGYAVSEVYKCWWSLKEDWWRFWTGRTIYLCISIIVILFIFLVSYLVLPYLVSHYIKQTSTLSSNSLNSLATMAEDLSKIISLLISLLISPIMVSWGFIRTFNESLLSGSTRAAKRYSELTNDPTDKIKKHFEELITQLNDRKKRVVIFIDDLDRCHSNYVVELLECIQTLYRETSVVFVVVADRRWLDACYEDVYTMKNSCVLGPGKTLGCLFLEKAFRFSAPVPRIPDALKERYWSYLLNVATSERKEDVDYFKIKAKEEISDKQSEEEVRKFVAGSRKTESKLKDDLKSFKEKEMEEISKEKSEEEIRKLEDDIRKIESELIYQRLLREEAAVKLASSDIMERLEHDLKPYSELLNPNPRSMKLLVNAYSLNSALAILSEEEIEFHQLVLWTILSSRWPQLASYLEEFPEMLNEIKIDQKDVSDIPENLKPLFSDKEVKKIVQGHIQRKGPLILETVIKCSHLHA